MFKCQIDSLSICPQQCHIRYCFYPWCNEMKKETGLTQTQWFGIYQWAFRTIYSCTTKLCCYTEAHLSFKGASKWKKFPLISAHRYYGVTPHELDILTSFLIRIWIKFSNSVSQLQIGWFLWFLDQIFSYTLTANDFPIYLMSTISHIKSSTGLL